MSNSLLSIIICSINDQEETWATIKSIRETAGDEPEIILVDDCSGSRLKGDWRFENIPNLKLVSNKWRCGCGPSRHIGALNANFDWLLITDSHMRFPAGWYEAWKAAPWKGSPKTVFCATCLQLNRKHLDVNHPMGEYNGATFNFHGPDRQFPNLIQTLECVWLNRDEQPKEDCSEIPAIMGAGYFVNRSWFLHLDATRFLRTWGGDEIQLSMKSWLAGGSVRLLRSVRIGHRFPEKQEHKWFNLPLGHVQFNKVMAAHSLFPADVASRLVDWVLTPQDKNQVRDIEAAKLLVRSDWHIIAQEMARNKLIFQREPSWICDKFGLILP